MAQLYTELDYAHLFSDGNGRCLRVFTRHLANEVGYTIRWETFALNNVGRDLLYIARDKSVNQLARPHLQHEHSLRKIIQTEACMAKSRDLQSRDVVRPLRSLAFERLTQTQALQVHPELTAAYKTMSRADQQFEASAPNSPQARRTVLDRVKAQIQKRLNDGETYHFKGPEQALLARTTVGHPRQLQPGRDRRAWEGARLRQTLQRESGRAVAATRESAAR